MKTYVHFDHISVSSYSNDKCFGQNLQRKPKHILFSVIFLFSKILPFVKQC
jgi:hypothetical protein